MQVLQRRYSGLKRLLMHFGGNRQWMFPMTLNSGYPTWVVPATIKFSRGTVKTRK